ncbi:MAG: hypothetical protein WDN23_10405 [Edaphobacter sp.]
MALAIGCGGHPAVSTTDTPPPDSPIGIDGDQVETCAGGILPAGDADNPIDLQISGITCTVDGSGSLKGVSGSYAYRNVNILNGGTLKFTDTPIDPNNPQIDFHAHSILVEMNGTLQASSINYPLTIWLWGAQDDGIPAIKCLSSDQCGVSEADWNSNPNVPMKMMPGSMKCTPASSQLNLNKDCFYQYEAIEASGDNPHTGEYFGNKVLAVSAGGSLMLSGTKGMRAGPIETNPADSGTSWGRLTSTLKGVHGGGNEQSFTIDRAVPTWAPGDHIIVTTTDYLPSHTEELIISSISGNQVSVTTPVQWPHNGQTYDYSAVAAANPNAGPAPDPAVTNLPAHNIETRAIVGLLTRNIVIASEGKNVITDRNVDGGHFPVSQGYYGGQVLVRQGFSTVQLQGVEFYQLGQGGHIGHYPIHFHMDRTVPQPGVPFPGFLGTYVADSSIVDSMTRFITVHATQGVTLARNVGYMSIGHGFYLEDATETDNKLYSNVAVSVRGALADSKTNPRMIPGILFQTGGSGQIPDDARFHTDVTTPAAFWIMNTWNDFKYNAAVGVGTCGACYWMVPASISGPSQYETWNGYAGMQGVSKIVNGQPIVSLPGGVPLFAFKGNSCSAAMNSLMTVGQTAPCNGVNFGPGSDDSQLYAVQSNPNQLDPGSYPIETNLRSRATLCDDTNPPGNKDWPNPCATAPPCTSTAPGIAGCAATVIDHYTTSFNWAQTNIAAIWLRGAWFLLDNSSITDVQNGGLTFISGGGYSRSDAPQGYWSVLKNSVLVGNTQPTDPSGNPYASNAGPFNPKGLTNCSSGQPAYCVSQNDGISFQGSDFAVNQRLFSIYDGPTNQYNNIYSDIHPTILGTLSDCKSGGSDPGNCSALQWFSGYSNGVLQQQPVNGNPQASPNCFLPNAAIAWKQPNGFYYPPAFNSSNLVFNNVDIRHFVIEPLYRPGGGYIPNLTTVKNTYCTWENAIEKGFTDIDRQTELTDNDGSLTGLTSNNTLNDPSTGPAISITKGSYFNTPLNPDECASGQLPPAKPTDTGAGATVTSSPYEYVTTALIPPCAANGSCDPPCDANDPHGSCDNIPRWAAACGDPQCYGVPLYRQTVTDAELNNIKTPDPTDLTKRPAVRMMGQGTGQRSTLTLNHAHYYIDTSLSGKTQLTPPALPGDLPPDAGPQQVLNINVFQPSQTYTVFFVFGSNSTKQSYSMFIGTGLSPTDAQNVMVPARVLVPGGYQVSPSPGGAWATFGGYDPGTGVLTVNVDLSGADDLEPKNRSDSCQPANFCTWKTTNSCGCKAGSACSDDKVCSYGPKNMDCPTIGGCYGFNLTLPASFQAIDAGVTPPTPQMTDLFENTDPYFQKGTVTFTSVPSSVGGACFYKAPPTPDEMIKGLQNMNGIMLPFADQHITR